MPFPIGSNVILQVKGSKYNGRRGVVKSDYCADKNNGRQNVLLSDDGDGGISKMVNVKPENMQLAAGQKVMGGGDANGSNSSDPPPKNNIRCAACGKADGELLQCACKSCKKLKGMTYPIFYCNNNGTCQKLNEQEHMRQQTFMISFTNMLIDAKKKEWEGKDRCRMFEGDEQLFADPPKREECPICCLPFEISGSTIYQACCGKDICHGCIHHVNFSTDECPCPYCRTPACLDTEQRELITRLNKRADGGDGEAFRTLGIVYSEGWHGLEKDMKKAIGCWNKGAGLGSMIAHYYLGVAYLEVHDVKEDVEKAKHHLGIAAIGGNIDARRRLGQMEIDEMSKTAYREAGFVNGVNLARAAKHYSIAAKAGCEKSMSMITTGYSNDTFRKYITKNEYEMILRAHKDATDAMKSDQRDEAAKWDILQEIARK